MMKVMRITSILLASSLVCGASFADPSIDPQGGFDISAPRIDHSQMKTEINEGELLVISASVNDNRAVDSVTLFFRSGKESAYQTTQMSPMTPGSNIYGVEIAVENIQYPKFDYYIEAKDTAGNTELKGISFKPLRIEVVRLEKQNPLVKPKDIIVTNAENNTGQAEAADTAVLPKMESKTNTWRYWLIGTLAASAATSFVYYRTRGGSETDTTAAGGETGTITINAPPL